MNGSGPFSPDAMWPSTSVCGPDLPLRVRAARPRKAASRAQDGRGAHQEVAPKAAKCGDGRQETGLKSRDGSPARRSQVRRAKPICRPKSLASRRLRHSERSQSRRPKPASRKEASRAQDGRGATSGGRAAGSQLGETPRCHRGDGLGAGLEDETFKRLSRRHRPSGERVDPAVGGGVSVVGFGLGGVVSEASLPSIVCSNPFRSVQKVPGPA